MSVVGGKVSARQVAAVIVDSAVNASFDCTGVVDQYGIHGFGHGYPPCIQGVGTKKVICPDNSAGPGNVPLDDISQCRCNAGYTGPDGGECTACGQGKYKPSKGNATCTTCPDHSSHSSVARVSVTDCQCSPAYFGADGEACEPCAPATYKDVWGSSMCQKCPANSRSPAASDSLEDCECIPGYEGPDGGPCKACPAGKFDDPTTSSDTCANCPAHSDSEAASVKSTDCKCMPGYTGPDGGMCEECPEGTYKDTFGSEPCVNLCPANSNSPAGSDEITDCECNAGYEGDDGEVCTPCEAGKFTPTAGADDCTPCPPNSFSQVGSSEVTDCTCNRGYTGALFYVKGGEICEACEAGTFKVTAGTGDCEQCPAGKFSDKLGAFSPDVCEVCPEGSSSPPSSDDASDCQCNAGFAGPDGGPCVICESGKYKEGIGDGDCNQCPEADSTSPPGSTSADECLTTCSPGSFGPDGGECELCEPGKFKAVGGTSPCTETCPVNADSKPGSTALTDCECNAGFTGPNGGECEACLAGSYKADKGPGACDECPKDTYSEATGAMSSDTCVACPEDTSSGPGSPTVDFCVCKAGFIGSDGGECEACPPGKYSTMPGADECSDCAAGTYSTIIGAVSSSTCEPCSKISSSDAGATFCECNKGYTGPDLGPCHPCEWGKYKDTVGSSECVTCPDKSTHAEDAEPGSFTELDCMCNAGHSGPNGGPCVPCEEGTYKIDLGEDECASCPANSDSAAGSEALEDCKCVPGFTGMPPGPCTPCPEGTYKDTFGSESCVNLCPANSHSPAASDEITDCVCNAGYTGSDGDACFPCESGKYKPAAGSEACTACPANSNSPQGSIMVVSCVCDEGYSGMNGDCEACEAGKYKIMEGNGDCEACLPGKYSSSVAATSSTTCVDCPEGSTSGVASSARTDCECVPPKFGPAGGPCKIKDPCAPGSTGPDGGPCDQCEAGKFKPTPGSEPCTDCPEETDSPKGSTSLNDCEGKPQPCDPGYTGPDGGPCEPCTPGTYKAITGSSLCIVCPDHSTSDAGATECACEVGWWGYPQYTHEEESEGVHFVGGADPPNEPYDSPEMFRQRHTTKLVKPSHNQMLEDLKTSQLITVMPPGDKEITICHATGSETKPYEMITIDVSAVPDYENEKGTIIPAPMTAGFVPAPYCPDKLIVNWCKICRQDVTLEFEDAGKYYCPGGTRRYKCHEDARSGINADGVADATPCECDYGWKIVDGKKMCKDADDWGSWDPATHLPRVGCLDTVSRADYARYTDEKTGLEIVAPTNRFYGSKMFSPKGIGLSDPGYLDIQEADAMCTVQSGVYRTSNPLVADKNKGCPDPCAYKACNLGQNFTVQCPDHCFTAAGVVYGSMSSNGVLGPYQDISAICRAAILSGARNDKPFYATFTIVKPVSEYQDPGGGRVVFDRWDRTFENPIASNKCCKGGWPPRLGKVENARLKYRTMFFDEWQNVRAFQIDAIHYEEDLCPPGMAVTWEEEGGHKYINCLLCPANTFKDTWGRTECTACPSGKSSESGARTCSFSAQSPAAGSALGCSAGFSGSPCAPCPAGTFKEEPGSGECVKCDAGKYSVVAGAVSRSTCSPCSAVATSSAGSSSCQCNTGYTGPDMGPCHACEAGKFKDVAGSGACSSCHSQATSAAGSMQSIDCECNAGFTGPDGGACHECAPGTFKNTAGSAPCTACPASGSSPAGSSSAAACVCGTGTTGLDGGTCAVCESGKYKDSLGTSRCARCPLNMEPDKDASACVCRMGFIPVENPKDELHECTPQCKTDERAVAKGDEVICEKCPENSGAHMGHAGHGGGGHVIEADADPTTCSCKPGMWGNPYDGCQLCSENAEEGQYYCPGGSQRFLCPLHARSGTEGVHGLPDSSPCLCENGFKMNADGSQCAQDTQA